MTRAALFLVALTATASAQITDGDALPLADASVRTVDGSRATLRDAAGPEGLVVVFWGNACPWTTRYAERLASLVEQYQPAGFGFVLVNSNDPADENESASTSSETAAASGLTAPYIEDAAGQLASAFGARSVPHAFLFGPDLRLLYDGTLDDSPASPARVQVPYLALAMDQSIAGLPIEVQRTQAFGCTIKRSSE